MGKWGKYSPKYSKVWERDTDMKEWIKPVPDDVTKASCKYCKAIIRAHRSDLIRHSGTGKHKKGATRFVTHLRGPRRPTQILQIGEDKVVFAANNNSSHGNVTTTQRRVLSRIRSGGDLGLGATTTFAAVPVTVKTTKVKINQQSATRRTTTQQIPTRTNTNNHTSNPIRSRTSTNNIRSSPIISPTTPSHRTITIHSNTSLTPTHSVLTPTHTNMAQVLARAAPRNLGRLVPQNTCLFLCDMQEKFRSSIQYFPQIVEVSNRLLRAFKVLDLPIVCTEQYPKGLGNTVPELGVIENNVPVFDKTKFTMCVPPIQEIIKDKEIKSVVLCGIESHVCVQLTCLDLLESGLDVHLVVDACSSRSMVDRMYSFERMRDSGAFLTTSESVILGLAGGSAHPSFKQLQKIIWESAPDTGLLPARQAPLLQAIADQNQNKEAKL